MMQDQQLLSDFHSLPPDKQAEVLDFVSALKKRSRPKRATSENDPILQVAGCVSGPPIGNSREIDEELYG